jgi:hypothetical protein
VDGVLVLLGVSSVVLFAASLVVVPWLVARLPADYFAHRHREHPPPAHPAWRLSVLVVKNLVGATLVLAGIAMLVLPGQGLLSILAGVMLMDFPGKYQLERRIVGNHTVLSALNWIRARAHKPPLVLDESRDRLAR